MSNYCVDVTHEKMIDIVKHILDNMVDEPAPSKAEVEEARTWPAKLWQDFNASHDITHSKFRY